MTLRERDITLPGGRTLHTFEVAPAGQATLALAWHHGSPQTGAPLEPVVEAAAARGIHLFAYARPSYGGSSDNSGRDVASAASDTAAVADALGIGDFASMGASGGGPHALAGAAVLGDRVTGVVTLAGLAPFSRDVDWFAGMASPDGIASAYEGRAARASFEDTAEFDPSQFIAADYAALEGAWASLGQDVARSQAWGAAGLIDDDVAFASPWGVDLGDVAARVLIVQGAGDRVVPAAHAELLARGIPGAEVWLRPADGHISVLNAVPAAMDWLLGR